MADAQQIFATLALTTPARRFAAGTLVTGGLLIALEPQIMFQDGQPKQWSMLVGEEDTDIGVTLVPWWMAAVGVGATLGLFF